MTSTFDFLNAMDHDFESANHLIRYIEDEVDLTGLSTGMNLVGSVNDYPQSDSFIDSLGSYFDLINSSGDLHLLKASVDDKAIPYYVYFDETFPIFLTTANITDEMPPTINAYLRNTPNVGRFWLSQRQMEEIRKNIIANHNDVLIPFFSANRTPSSEIPANRRPDVNRSITYYADDGRETYREMRHQYGVLPRILEFERPNHFKFRIKNRGVFVHERGSIEELWKAFQREKDRKKRVKSIIDTSNLTEKRSGVFENAKISVSEPWAIEVNSGIEAGQVKNFRSHLNQMELEFGVSEYDSSPSIPSFEAELIDSTSFETTRLMSNGDTIRIYPRELTDIDQSFRIYNFVSDHFGPNCRAVEV